MKRSILLTIVSVGAILALAGSALAGDFSPEMTLELSDTKVKANPEIKLHVAQDEGEEELKNTALFIPKGFKIPTDEQVPDGDVLGEGEIVIDVGPACRSDAFGGIPLTVPLNAPAELAEKDRTDEQVDEGVYAVWELDISGVTSIELVGRGSPKTGFTFAGDIPQNDNTCPPFEFDLTVFSQSESGVKLLTNPKKPGTKVFTLTFDSNDSPATVTLEAPIKITK